MSGGRPSDRDSWGWHPLTGVWARRIVETSGVRAGDLVVDIGAGEGALTLPLLEVGARVVAVELHPGRIAALRALATEHPRLTVVATDARDLRLPRRPFRVVSNPPYAGCSQILRRLLSPGSRLVAADLVVQRQLARRWVEDRPPGHGRWSATFDVRVVGPLPRTAFQRRPRVDSVVMRIARRHADVP